MRIWFVAGSGSWGGRWQQVAEPMYNEKNEEYDQKRKWPPEPLFWGTVPPLSLPSLVPQMYFQDTT